MTLELCADDRPPSDDPAERVLIDRARRDPEAFARLYRMHYACMARYVHRRTGRADVTEDLVSEVFVTAMRKLPRYRHRGMPFRAWLYRIASNAVNQWARRERRRRKRDRRNRYVTHSGTAAPRGSNIEPHDVRRAFLEIGPEYQTVRTLHHLEGLSIEQIALVLRRPPGTVKSRLHRARQALRDALTKRWDDGTRA